MPTWAEVVGDMPEPPKDDGRLVPALKAMRERLATAAAALADERNRADSGTTAPGQPLEEPPLTVARINVFRRNGSQSHLVGVRCVNGGWWWIREGQTEGIPAEGWAWKDNGSSMAKWRDATTAADRARVGEPTCYRFDSDEPPPWIVRLRQHPTPPDDPSPHVTRCVNGGWHWVAVAGRPCCDTGWDWWAGDLPRDSVLVPVYPEVDRDRDTELMERLAGSLPDDGGWYWIAIDVDTGQRLWACHDDDGDLSFTVGNDYPDVSW